MITGDSVQSIISCLGISVVYPLPHSYLERPAVTDILCISPVTLTTYISGPFTLYANCSIQIAVIWDLSPLEWTK